ncbi:metallophosphoesterase [Mumia zhuanghuii]|uniref:Metallophosphoesterase n=1 Tax=Mumia zhuanghuii TaxID=2585211 RepID=A0A5C4MTC4_9ACTN|nr:metallophosphoesterase [Mumia zhuanghuii]TNC47018.1 metallophosphoesterase [Mumia zhuanghuii]TNC47857.1 metallophosphoesterase [Mumia zhuanghuii]
MSELNESPAPPEPVPTDPAPVAARRRRHRWLPVALLVAVALAVASVVALATFTHAHRTVIVGAHSGVVTPTFDGHATLDFGSVLPQIRVPVDAPFDIGVAIDIGDTEADSLDEVVARDAVIASQPEAEIAQIGTVVRDIAIASALRGLGVGLAVALVITAAWMLVGRARRHDLAERARSAVHRRNLPHTPVRAGIALGLGAVLALVLITWPEPAEEQVTDTRWRPIRAVYPEIPADLDVGEVQISSGSATDASRAIVESAIATYDTSMKFYGAMEKLVPEIAPQLRQPLEGETVAVLVSDRHDNVGMDPVVRAVADEVGASLLIDAGDDTSTGGSWESFSIRSLARQFRDIATVAVAGNHDEGPYITEQMAEAGFTVLDGEATDVEGIRFLGYSDPRSSGLTAGWSQGSTSIKEQGEELTETACEDGDVSTVVVHSPTTGEDVAASGCVDLVLSGHLHVQRGPTVTTAPNGRKTVSFTNASTGGAAFAFALGSKLRRTAQATLITYSDGRPVGLQPVNFNPDGAITVAEYVPFDLTPGTPDAPSSPGSTSTPVLPATPATPIVPATPDE